MRHFTGLIAMLLASQLSMPSAVGADGSDDIAVGTCLWRPSIEAGATEWDKTNYWGAIGISPSTGKFGMSCEWLNRDNAEREARKNCNEKDAKTVVMCCNGWCALAMGKVEKARMPNGASVGAPSRRSPKSSLWRPRMTERSPTPRSSSASLRAR